jgi:hypothetical protein
MEKDEWSAGSRSRIQLCAMTPRRVCHSYCTRHSEKININGRSRISGSRHCPQSGCEGRPWLSGSTRALPFLDNRTSHVGRTLRYGWIVLGRYSMSCTVTGSEYNHPYRDPVAPRCRRLATADMLSAWPTDGKHWGLSRRSSTSRLRRSCKECSILDSQGLA